MGPGPTQSEEVRRQGAGCCAVHVGALLYLLVLAPDTNGGLPRDRADSLPWTVELLATLQGMEREGPGRRG